MKPEKGYKLYNINLKELSKKNRNNPTRPEEKIWYKILNRKQTGFKFLRQKPMNNFILDFYCSKLLLAIEVDGDSHAEKEEYDQMRTDTLNALGIKVIRYTNEEVLNNIDGVWEDLAEKLKLRKKELKQ